MPIDATTVPFTVIQPPLLNVAWLTEMLPPVGLTVIDRREAHQAAVADSNVHRPAVGRVVPVHPRGVGPHEGPAVDNQVAGGVAGYPVAHPPACVAGAQVNIAARRHGKCCRVGTLDHEPVIVHNERSADRGGNRSCPPIREGAIESKQRIGLNGQVQQAAGDANCVSVRAVDREAARLDVDIRGASIHIHGVAAAGIAIERAAVARQVQRRRLVDSQVAVFRIPAVAHRHIQTGTDAVAVLNLDIVSAGNHHAAAADVDGPRRAAGDADGPAVRTRARIRAPIAHGDAQRAAADIASTVGENTAAQVHVAAVGDCADETAGGSPAAGVEIESADIGCPAVDV